MRWYYILVLIIASFVFEDVSFAQFGRAGGLASGLASGFNSSSSSSYNSDNPDEDEPSKKIPTIDTTYLTHSPTRAMIYSAVLPGLGQAYNKKYWKIPIVYGAIGGCVGWLIYCNDIYNDYRRGYVSFMDKDPNTNYFKKLDLRGLDADGNVRNASLVEAELESVKSQFDRNRSLAMLAVIFAYALNIIDASVDAHFFNFDVSDDVAIKFDPLISPEQYTASLQYGVSCRIRFK